MDEEEVKEEIVEEEEEVVQIRRRISIFAIILIEIDHHDMVDISCKSRSIYNKTLLYL